MKRILIVLGIVSAVGLALLLLVGLPVLGLVTSLNVTERWTSAIDKRQVYAIAASWIGFKLKVAVIAALGFSVLYALIVRQRHAMLALFALAPLAALVTYKVLGGPVMWQLAAKAKATGIVDPIFNRDMAFYVFELPVLGRGMMIGLTLIVLTAVGLLIGSVLAGVAYAWLDGRASSDPDTDYDALTERVRERFLASLWVLGGAALIIFGIGRVIARYSAAYDSGKLFGGEGLIGGADKARDVVWVPSVSIMGFAVIACGAVCMLMAIPRVRVLLTGASAARTLAPFAAIWAVAGIALVIVATAWWLIAVVVMAIIVGVAMVLGSRATFADDFDSPILAGSAVMAGAAVLTLVGAWLLPSTMTKIYDGVGLRGPQLQIQEKYLDRTLKATRKAQGLDRLTETKAPYVRGGVKASDITENPSSVTSLRFLDYGPAIEACNRTQAFSQWYACNDADLDRYKVEDKDRMLFILGRDVDTGRTGKTDWQRRHLTYTHGYGVVAAPVNELDSSGRPKWQFSGIPQKGIELDRPEIYHSASDGLEWVLVDTKQKAYDADELKVLDWKGDTGVKVGRGFDRFALTYHLEGWPLIGRGRQLWNTTRGNPAGPDSKALLYRSIHDRANEIAPFLLWDRDPYVVAEGGKLTIVMAGYSATSRYPYARDLNMTTQAGKRAVSYAEQSVIMTMDAYSGETHLWADLDEPLMRTYSAVYDDIFEDSKKMPKALKDHMRYGEDLFNLRVAAVSEAHMESVDTYFNGDEQWSRTAETYGPGINAKRQASPARYTYALMPGETKERFVLLQSFKPAAKRRGIAFSGWLAASNDADRFGELTLLNFDRTNEEPLDSLDTFSSNVDRDPDFSAQLGLRKDSVTRGNVMVVPVGKGLLYVQPFYLDTHGDSLPSLWQVVISFGDGKIYYGSTFAEALAKGLGASVDPDEIGGGDPTDTEGEGTEGKPGTGTPPAGTPSTQTLTQAVATAAREYEAYEAALAGKRYDEAAAHLKAFREALQRAQTMAK